MHDVRVLGEDRESAGLVDRRYRPWCLCGWIGEWTAWEGNQKKLPGLRTSAHKQFMGHLEAIKPYIENPMRVVGRVEEICPVCGVHL